MTVTEAIKWIETEMGRESSARVEVIPAYVGPSGERTPVPVMDVSVDASDREVHLLVNSAPGADAPATEHFSVGHLLSALRSLDAESLAFNLVSGTWIEIDAEHVGRRDWPFEGLATNSDRTAVAFVEA